MNITKAINKTKFNAGFTLVEVVVSSLVFAIAAAGVYATVTYLGQPAAESTQEITAAYIGKQILDELRADIDASTWTDATTSRVHPAGGTAGGGGVGIYSMMDFGYTSNTITVDRIVYTPTYTVTTDGITGGRKVTLDITWAP